MSYIVDLGSRLQESRPIKEAHAQTLEALSKAIAPAIEIELTRMPVDLELVNQQLSQIESIKQHRNLITEGTPNFYNQYIKVGGGDR